MRKIVYICIFAIAALIYVTGCSDSSESRSYPSSWLGITGVSSNSRVTVKIGNQNPYVGKTIPIVIGVFDAVGSPIAEASVSMTSDNGGSFGDDSYETDSRGYANVVFTPTNAGSTLITAAAGGFFGTSSVQISPSISGGPTVTLFTSSDVVDLNGRLIIQVHGTDDNGTELDSAPVNLSCEVGTLADTDGTTSSGWFTTTYTAPNTTGVATITAMINGTVAVKTVSVR